MLSSQFVNEIMQRLNELERRLANSIIIATISDVDYDNNRAQATAGDLVTGWLRWTSERAGGDTTYWAPEKGEQVVIACPNGNLEQGVITDALYCNEHPALGNKPTIHRTRYKDGAVIEYNRESHALTANLPAGATTYLASTGGLKITGDVEITGKLLATKSIKSNKEIIDKAASMSADRAIFNAHTQVVSGSTAAAPSIKQGAAI